MDDDDGGGGTHPPPPPYADTWEAMENPDRGRPGANGKPKVPSHMLRLQVMMRAYRRGRTFGVLENKLLSHTAVSRLGLPAVPVLYGSTVKVVPSSAPAPPQGKRAQLAAPGGSRHPGREAGPPGAQPLP